MVFVSGATGLVGGYLLLELSKRDEKIRAAKRKNTSLDAVRSLFNDFSDEAAFHSIEWVEMDLLDIPSVEKALEGVETVFHTAGYISFDDREKKKLWEVNATGTDNLVNISLAKGVKNLLALSSIAVLDPQPDKPLITEKSKWDPEAAHSEYAITKKKAELAVWRGSEEGLNVIIVYPGIIIGSLDGRRESEKLFRLAAKDKVFSTEGVTAYTDVRDVAFCLVELYEKGKFGKNYILNAGERSYAQIIDHLRNRAGKPPSKVLSVNKLRWARRISIISKLFGGKYLSKASLAGLTERSEYSNEKIKEALDFEFIPVEEALDFHWERFKKQKK